MTGDSRHWQWFAIPVVGLAIGLTWWYLAHRVQATRDVRVETAQARVDVIRQFITATGTLQPLNAVDVGTQVSGTLQRIHVDFNDPVHKGQLLAELDRTFLQSTLEEARADLNSAQADLDFYRNNLERLKSVATIVSRADLDSAQHNVERSEAALVQAQSRVSKAQINLGYAIITSPIEGVIIHRAVEEGQTVAASLNAPVLFRIAESLTRMQVQADVAEADIGQVRTGQQATFEVDAFPGTIFSGSVTQIRLQPKVISNVVTYTVIINAANPDLYLLPGMTANISIITFLSEAGLTVPEQAVHFQPDPSLLADYFAGKNLKMEKYLRPADRSSPLLWVKRGDQIERVPVTLGKSDGVNIQVLSGVDPGQDVVLNLYRSNPNSTVQRSPFMPTRPRQTRN